ncbi:MAG: protein-L-isoaspartate(D-aspartate) O-methyltransferase [bacterium]
MSTIASHRRFYAEFLVRAFGSGEQRLIDAFAAIPREDFVGPGPWQVCVGSDEYISTGTDDPALLYQDILVGLAPERRINNGQPSLHARSLSEAAPALGERVLHVGAGTGYYTAILATLVGATGHVDAFEIESDLAARATTNLAHLGNVVVHGASASDGLLRDYDVIYVNAGTTHPPPAWLDALRVGGRMVFPLTPNEGVGIMLRITRLAADSYAATAFARVAFVPCIGARNEVAAVSLAAALERGSNTDVRSLRREEPPDHTAWCVGDGWWLSCSEPRRRET